MHLLSFLAPRRLHFCRIGWCTATLALLGGICPAGVAATPWVARHFGSTQGLPVASASNSAVDGDGFLWLATHDGLARFDGHEFTVYDAARFPEMGGNRIRAVYADGFGGIYALGPQGEWLSVKSDAVFRTPLGSDMPPQEAKVRFVQTTPLCITLESGLYCASEQGMRLRRRFEGGFDVRLAMASGEHDWLLVQDQGVLLCDARACEPRGAMPLSPAAETELHARLLQGSLLLGMPEGLLEISSQPASMARWLLRDRGRPLDLMQLRTEDSGVVMLGTGHGLFRVANGEGEVRGTHGRVALSWRAPDGALWRSDQGDLFREGERVLQSRGQITSLLFGADGSVYVTTLRDGMYVLTLPRLDLLGVDPALRDGNLYGLAPAGNGDTWLGSLGDGLFRMDALGRSRRYMVGDGLPGENIWAVAVAPDQQVYAASFLPGLWALDQQADRFDRVVAPPPLDSAQVRALTFDRDGQLWVGGGAGAWQRTDAGWQQRWPLGESAMVLAIVHQADGVVWYGGERGLWRQQGLQAWPVAANLLDGAAVRGLFEASDGAIWAASEGRGLIRVAADDPHGERARRLGRTEGLPSNSPHSIIEDRLGDLWVNSNQGIFRIARVGVQDFLEGRQSVLSPLTLGLVDGLSDLEGNGGVQPAAGMDADGRILFPTQRGVVRFDPLRLPLRREPPQAVIDGLEQGGHRLALVQGELPVGARSIQLSYNAADLQAGHRVRFRYRLQPGEEAWTDAGTRRVAAFASLPPGTFRFEVLAGNSDGIWARQPASVEFTVPAYWYETRGFQLLLLGAALLAGMVLVHWRLVRLRRRAALLDQQVQLRTRELSTEKQRVEHTLGELAEAHEALATTHEQIAERNRRLADQATRLQAQEQSRSRLLADVSHELRTPLMLIRLPLQELVEGSRALAEQDRQRLQLPYQQTERLSQLVEQLLGLVQAEGGQLPLQLQRIELVSWCDRQLAGFEPVAQRQQVGLRLHAAHPPLVLYADPTHLTTIVGNLLDNALKYAPPGSEVQLQVALDAEEEHACLRVVDQGAGFSPELADSLFQRFVRLPGPPRGGREGLGIGLALARELVELHGGRIGANIVDGTGTVFWLQLPLGSAHVQLDELQLEPSSSLPAVPVDSGGAGGILLVEDHPELAAYLKQRIAEFYPITAVVDAEAALQRLQAGDIHLLISDVVLPGMDGVTLCRQLKASPGLADLPVILISAKAARTDREQGLAAGAAVWLSKPFAFSDLLDAVTRLWRAPAATIASGAEDAAFVPDPLDGLLQRALAQMANPEFGVAQWADACHLSDRQLRRRIAELTGMSPLIWLREQRLLRARSLLGEGSCQTLVEAGQRVGLCNPAYLYRLYRARFGD